MSWNLPIVLPSAKRPANACEIECNESSINETQEIMKLIEAISIHRNLVAMNSRKCEWQITNSTLRNYYSQFRCACQWNRFVHQHHLHTMDCEQFFQQPKRHHFCLSIQSMFHFARLLYRHNQFEILGHPAKIEMQTNHTENKCNIYWRISHKLSPYEWLRIEFCWNL